MYGGTYVGGIGEKGVIFSEDTNGSNYQVIHYFSDPTGANTYGNFTLVGKKLFGMTENGGIHENGVVFSIDTTGADYKVLLLLDTAHGLYPHGSLLFTSNKLYGMTIDGGANDYGVIFSIDTDGTHYADLYDMNYINGTGPQGGLTQAGNAFYGMAQMGGPGNDGTIFRFQPISVYFTVADNILCNGTSTGSLVAHPTYGKSPYTYLWSPVGETTATATGLSAGTYTVTVTDSAGDTFTVTTTLTQPSPIVLITDSVNATSGCNGMATVTASGGTPSYKYLWSPGGATTDTIKGLCSGSYCCKVSDIFNCTKTTCINIVSGISQLTANTEQLKVYPNPSSGIFELMDNGQLTMSNKMQIVIYNTLGQKVYSKLSIVHFPLSINLGNQPDGIYFYRLFPESTMEIVSGKIVIAH